VGGGVELLVADAYLGILRVDTATGNVTTVVATGENHPGLALPNDLDVTADGATAFFSNTGMLFSFFMNFEL
jgi:sugar lactone lactonase YvrE